MKVEALEISRQPSYGENPNELVGKVELSGPTGKLTVRLSAKGISAIFSIVAEEVAATAKFNAKQVEKGMEDAIHEPMLVEASKVELLA